MDEINFDDMSMEELRALRGRIDRAIASFEDRKRRDALAAIEHAARQHGYNLADLTGTTGRGRRGAAAAQSARSSGEARYANPAEPSMTWTGRGRRPRWVTEQIEAGRSLEDMAL